MIGRGPIRDTLRVHPVTSIAGLTRVTTASSPTRLVIVRGNSASGKSSVAAGLRERDVPGGANIGLIDLTVRHALEHGFHTVLEGILNVAEAA
jgi:adenylylsulfate kinase-like enzyme